MPDFNMCNCGALIDDVQGAKCGTCKTRESANTTLKTMIDDVCVEAVTSNISAYGIPDTLPSEVAIIDFVASKDAEIERLKQELLGLNMAYDIQMARANALGEEYRKLSFHVGAMEQAEREAAVNEGYEAGYQACKDEIEISARQRDLNDIKADYFDSGEGFNF